MNTLYEPISNKQYIKTSQSIEVKNKHETVSAFKALTLKEKCLYLVKLSKKNTRFQALWLMGLSLLIITADYLLL